MPSRPMTDHSAHFDQRLDLLTRLRRLAQIAVHEAAAVGSGEKLTVVTDSGGDPRLASLIAQEGRAAGAEVVMVWFPQVDSIHDIPERVEQAIDQADVVIPVCRSRILYSRVIKDVSTHGRLLYMADVPTENFLRPVVLESDYEELARLAAAFGEIFSQDGTLRVTTRAGTDAVMEMRAERGMSISSCRVRQVGDHDYLPGGAWFGCPIEESVNGVFVVDCSMEPGVAGGVLHEPVVFHVQEGRVVKLEGGGQAEEFRSWLDAADPQIWGIAHNGGGFNRYASRIGNLMEDERIAGTFNIAGGNNQSGWPGNNSSSFHWDAMMLDASYSLAGTPICQAGEFVHPLLQAALGQ